MAKKLNERIIKINKDLIPKWIKVLRCPICNKKPIIWNDARELKSKINYKWLTHCSYTYITCFNCENITDEDNQGVLVMWNVCDSDIGIAIAKWNTIVENYINKETK